jgi:hypothetical protein
MRTHAFILTVWFGRKRAKLSPLLPSDDFWSVVKSEAENIISAGSEDYQWRFESLHC